MFADDVMLIAKQYFGPVSTEQMLIVAYAEYAKGQLTLRRDLLKHLSVRTGEKIEAHKLQDGRIIIRAAKEGSINDFHWLPVQTR